MLSRLCGAMQAASMAFAFPVVLMISAAKASTSVYVFGGLLTGTLQGCLANAKTAATKAGFTEYQQALLDANHKAGDFHASRPASPLAMTMRCDPSVGVYSIGVSGIGSKETFESLRTIVNSL